MTDLTGLALTEQPLSGGAAERAEWRVGWKAALAASLSFSCGLVIFNNTFSVFIAPITKATGWSTTTVLITPIILAIASLLSPIVGRLVTRFGPRRVASVSLVGMVVVLVAFAFVPTTFITYYTFAALLGILGSGAYIVAVNKVVVSWFNKSAGKAFALTGIFGAGVPASLTFLVSYVIYTFGYKAGYLVPAAAMLFLALPFTLWALRINPDEAKLHADAEAAISSDDQFGVLDAFKMPRVWLLGLTMTMAMVGLVGFSQNMQPIMLGAGMSVPAATAISALFLYGVMLGRILTGVFLDLINRYVVAITLFALCAIGALLLANVGGFPWGLALLAATLVALGQGCEADLQGYLVAKEFSGGKRYAVIMGAILPMIMVGQIAGPYIFGGIKDTTGSYSTACYVGCLFYVAAILLFIVMSLTPRSRRPAALTTA